ncbi:GNAT family protein [Paenarthrobacter sp. GOM3]|uniref:GNAT family N-acetyltransferase n=1 Tax=Paenarthrobacter sp. GOM3 TaxID=2782567 RepID=UPI001BAA5F73|nr:GNAT family protein [Paenarthrobacter sp. GOM3]WOH18340.1 GNAT family protein [Paenarthrobacter sp. GOM3]
MNLTRSLLFDATGTPASHGLLTLRPLESQDAGPLAAAYARNRDHLAPWDPQRSDEFFSAAGQAKDVAIKLNLFAAGSEVPWVLTAGERIIGRITLTGVVRGPFLSANMGYWIDQEFTGRGLASAAVGQVLTMAADDLGLHRVQAATLVHNLASQAVLKRSGFERIGMAPDYLQIAGEWQDHVLFQRILF